MNRTQIYKVQRSFCGRSILVYNESRRHYIQVPLPDDIKEFMGDEMKIYMKGFVDKDGQINLLRKVGTQAW